MFTPMPNVDSAVVNIKLNKNKYEIKDIELLRKVIRASFSMRRKTLANCLKTNFAFSGEQLEKIFESLGFDKNIRGEVLTTQNFVDLSNLIYDLKISK